MKDSKEIKDVNHLSEEEKLCLFDVEELETRLELAEVGWNDVCGNEGCKPAPKITE